MPPDQNAPARRRGVTLALSAVLLAGLAGCGGANLVPVQGRVLLDGKPLTAGTVIFHPDPDKGNTTAQIPQGEIDGRGTYTLVTGTKPGAPPGWYRVAVNAVKPFDPATPYAPEEWLIPRKYGEARKSGLSIQVAETVGAGSYDIRLTTRTK